MNNSIHSLLHYIYGPADSAALLEKLCELLDESSAKLPVSPEPYTLSERDILLITYADMLSDASGDEPAAKKTSALKHKPGSEPEPNTALQRLESFLSRHGEGVFTHVHLLPFFPWSSDDGFSVIDYRKVDEKAGSWRDIYNLSRDYRLAFDLVLNHGSAQSHAFKAFLRGEAPYDKWYLTRPASYDSSSVVRPRTHPLLTEFHRADGTPVFVWTTFSADQVDFDFSNPVVLLEFISIMLDYASRGCRVLRLDAIAYLWKEDGTPCLHHDKTHAVVKLLRAIVDELHLDLLLLTETNVPHQENVSYFGTGDEAHMVYNFALPPLVLHAAISGDAAPLRNWASKLPPLPKGQYFLNFLASHDGIGLTPAKGLIPEKEFEKTLAAAQERGGRFSYKSTPSGPIPYELNCTWLDAVAPPQGASTRQRSRSFIATYAVAMALSGLPAVYFHSWVGSPNWEEGVEKLGYNRAINREKPQLEHLEIEVLEKDSLRSMIMRGFRQMAGFRGSSPLFSPQSPQEVLESDGGVFALLRGPDALGRFAICAANLGSQTASFVLPERVGGKAQILEGGETRWMIYASSGTLESELVL